MEVNEDEIQEVVRKISELQIEDLEWEALYKTMVWLDTQLDRLVGRTELLEPLFALLERFPGVDFGSPGPIVVFLSKTTGYRESLLVSIGRRPTRVTVEMVNAIINSSRSTDERERWLGVLKKVCADPRIDEDTLWVARDFWEYQQGRDPGEIAAAMAEVRKWNSAGH